MKQFDTGKNNVIERNNLLHIDDEIIKMYEIYELKVIFSLFLILSQSKSIVRIGDEKKTGGMLLISQKHFFNR